MLTNPTREGAPSIGPVPKKNIFPHDLANTAVAFGGPHACHTTAQSCVKRATSSSSGHACRHRVRRCPRA